MSILIYKLDVNENSIYTVIQKHRVMSRKCELTGKSPLKRHKVSHANNKTKRKFLPNLKKVTFVSDILKKNIKLKVTNSALRSVDKKGSIDLFLISAKIVNLSPKAKKIKKLLIAKN
jgi:large subunit ribosomal protein L28